MNDPIIVERIYNAPIEKVWNAITDKDEMKKWYFDLAEFKAEPGFEFQFYGEGKQGQKFLHLCKVTEVISQALPLLCKYVYSYNLYHPVHA